MGIHNQSSGRDVELLLLLTKTAGSAMTPAISPREILSVQNRSADYKIGNRSLMPLSRKY